MPRCSNPVQCVTAKRTLCTCNCSGANHSKLRLSLESEDPKARSSAEKELRELKLSQDILKKDRKIQRRKNRAVRKKMTPGELASGEMSL